MSAPLALAGAVAATATGLTAPLTEGFRLVLDALDDGVIRVAIWPEGGLAQDRSWMVSPEGPAAFQGRHRLACDGFPCPGTLDRGMLRVRVEAAPLRLVFSDPAGRVVLEDRPGGAYQAFARRGAFRHWIARAPGTRYLGLGDKTGPIDRAGRRLRCLQTDSLGYDAETQDPLYKHAPWVIVETGGVATGILYDTLAEIALDLGAEHSNYFAPYAHAEVLEGGLVYYVLAGPRLSDVVPRLARLSGGIALPPRWAMGFAFTSMHHADDPAAQAVITAFAERARADDMPISAIHLGSGYTLGPDGRRYVFTWDTGRFPNRAAFFARLRALGLRTLANVKPVLLKEHPAYARAAAEGWFVRRADGRPAEEMFWGGLGASLDFTNPAARAWWADQARAQVLAQGFDGLWNDNNEAELWDEAAQVAGDGRPLPGIDARPLQALLMTRTSREATIAHRPDERPHSVTRAGPIGLGALAETWTGDNRTGWPTLNWNLRQALSMGLSAMPMVGHDIGGFDGPRPGPELLVRWVQMMAIHPRAVMNSWKPTLTEPLTHPWMHPETVDLVRAGLRLRYRLLPWLYHLAWRAHRAGHPVLAPLSYWYPGAPDEDGAVLLGPDLLAAPVVTEGARAVTVTLPDAAAGWLDLATGRVHPPGPATLPAPLERLPLLARRGAIIALAEHWPDTAPHDATRLALTAIPTDDTGTAELRLFHDDGLSPDTGNPAHQIVVAASWDRHGVAMTLEGPATRGAARLVAASADPSDRPLTGWR